MRGGPLSFDGLLSPDFEDSKAVCARRGGGVDRQGYCSRGKTTTATPIPGRLSVKQHRQAAISLDLESHAARSPDRRASAQARTECRLQNSFLPRVPGQRTRRASVHPDPCLLYTSEPTRLLSIS